MRKFLILLMLLMLVCTVAITAVACVEKVVPPVEEEPPVVVPPVDPVDPVDPTPPEPPKPPEPPVDPEDPENPGVIKWTADDTLAFIGKSLGNGKDILNFKTSAPFVVSGKEYTAICNANLGVGNDKLELYLAITDGQGKEVFALIIKDNMMFFGQGGKYFHLENIDPSYLKGLIDTIAPKLPSIIQEALAGLGDINTYIELIKGMLFSEPIITLKDGVYNISFALKISETLITVIEMLNTLGLDKILADSGIVLPGGSIEDLIKQIVIPEFMTMVGAKITEDADGNLTNNSTSLTITNVDGTIFSGATTFFTVSNEAVDCEIPEGIKTYDSFGLTQIAFNINFSINTKTLNINEMLAMFAGRDVLAGAPIILDIQGTITAVAKIDVDLVDNAKSYILLEFYEGNTTDSSKYIAGIYYVGADNAFYVKVASRFGVELPRIKIEGLNLTNLLDQIEAIIKTTIETALGGLTAEDKVSNAAASGATLESGTDLVTSIRFSDGKAAPVMDFMAFINSAIALTGLKDYVVVSDKGLSITINNDFIKALDSLSGGTIGTLPGDIGEAIIKVNTSEAGINDIDIAYSYMQNGTENTIGFNINNMQIGFPIKDLVKEIETAVGNKSDYTSNLRDIINGMLEGVELAGDVNLTFKKGEYNIGALIAQLGLKLDSGAIDLNKLIFNVSSDTVVSATIDLKMTYFPENMAKSQFFFELTFNENILFFKQGGKIGFYSVGGDSYLDMSNVLMADNVVIPLPKIKIANVDIMAMIDKAIEGIDMSLIITNPEIKTMADVSDIIGITLNERTLAIMVTSQAIVSLFKNFDKDIILPKFDVRLEINSINDIKIDLGFNDMLNLDVDITKAAFGGGVNIVMPNFEDYDESIDGYLAKMIGELKKGFVTELDVKLTLKNGEFAIGDLLAALDVKGVPNIKLDIVGDVTLDAKIKLGYKYDEKSSANTAMYIELILNQSAFGLNSGLLLGIYSINGKTYIDLSKLNIEGLTVKNLGLNIDLAALLNEQIDKALAPKEIAKMANEDNSGITINQMTLAIKLTSEFIAGLLAKFNSNLTLPVMDIFVEYSSFKGLALAVDMKDILSLDFQVKSITVGSTADVSIIINENDYIFSTEGLIRNVIDQVLAGTQLTLDVKIDFLKGTYNLKDLLANFKIFDIPDMILVLEDNAILDMTLSLTFAYDALNPENSRFALELILKDKFLFLNGSIENKLIGIYGIGGTTYIDLTGISVNGISIPKFRMDLDVMQLVADELAKLDLSGLANGGSVVTMAEGDATSSDLDLAIALSQNKLALAITSVGLSKLLSYFDITFKLPFDFDLTAEIDFTDTAAYDAKIDLSIDTILDATILISDLAFNGNINTDNLPNPEDFDNADWIENMKDVLVKALNQIVDHVSMTANVTAELPVGKYDFAKLVNHLGLLGTQVPNLIIDIVEVQRLNLTLDFNLDYNFLNVSKSQFYLKLTLKEAPVFFSELIEDASKPMIAIHGKNGNTYIDLSNIVIKGFRLPKVLLNDLDLVSMIAKELESSRFVDNMLDSIFGAPETKSIAKMASDNYVNIGLSTKAITISAAASAVAMILDVIGLKINLPEIIIGADFNFGESDNDSINNIVINLEMDNFDGGKFINASMSIKDVKAGEHNAHPSFGFDESGYIASLNQIIKDSIEKALSGMEINLDLDLTIKKGTYDISTLLDSLGIEGIPSLNLVFSEDVIASLTVKIVTNYDANVAKNSRMAIEIILNNNLYAGGSDIPVLKQGRLISLFSYQGATYVDLSGITIGNINLPSFKIELDVMSIIMSMLEELDVDSMLDELFNGTSGTGNIENTADSGIGGGGGTGGNTPDGEIEITDFVNIALLEKKVVLSATSKALAQLLGSFTGSEISLPLFDVNAFIGGEEIFGLKVNFKDANGVIDTVLLDMQMNKCVVGEDIDMSIFEGHAERAAEIDSIAVDKIKFIIYDLIKTIDASIELKLDTPQQLVDLTSIINRVLAMQGTQIELPINLHTDNFNPTFTIDIKWNLNFGDHSKSEAMIRIYSQNNVVDIRIMYKDNTLYVDLSRLGLIKFKVEQFNLTAMIDQIVSGLAPELNDSLASIINDLLGGGAASAELMSRMASSEAQSVMAEAVAEAQAGNQIVDILDILMKGVNIQDFIGRVNWTSEIFTAALASAGLSLGLPLSLDAEINVPEGYITATMMIDEIKIDLSATLNRIGGPARPIDWKNFTETLIMPENPDPTMSWQDYLDYELQDYGNYKLTSGLDLIMSIFGSTKISEHPGITPTAPKRDQVIFMNWTAKSATSNSGSVSISIERMMEARNTVLNYTAPRGSLLLTLYKNFGYSTPTIYIILDIVNGNLNIQGTTNLFSLVGNTGEMVNINIALDLKTMLGPLLDPILEKIPGNVLDGSTNDSMADELAEETPGFALDLNELLKSVNVSVSTAGQLRLNLDLGLESINDMLIDILDDLFMNLDKNILTGGSPSPAKIRYKDVLDNDGTFFSELYSNWLGPIINSMAGGGIVGGIGESALKSSFSDAVNRLLPLPRFTGGKVQMDILNGSLSNIFLDTYNNNTGKQASEQLNLEIYTKASKSNVEFTMDKITRITDNKTNPNLLSNRLQSANIIYDPYDTSYVLENQFSKNARRRKDGSGRQYSTNDTVTWSVANTSGGYDNITIDAVMKNTLQGADYAAAHAKTLEDGSLEYTFRGKAFMASAENDIAEKDKTVYVTVTVLPKKPISGIKDIIVYENMELPNRVPVVFNDESVRSITATINNATKAGAAAQTIEKNAENPAAGPHVVIDGVAYGITVRYVDSTVSFESEIVIDGYSKDTFVDTMEKYMYVTYASGAIGAVQLTWDISKLPGANDQVWVTGSGKETYPVIATMHGGTDREQKLTYNIKILSGVVDKIVLDGTANQLNIDPIDINLAKTHDDIRALLPKSGTIIYADGHSDVQEFDWSTTDVQTLINIAQAAGGHHVNYLNFTNLNGDIKWNKLITVEVDRAFAKYAIFSKDDQGNAVKTLTIDPFAVMYYDGIENVLAREYDIMMEDGSVRRLPVAWTYSDITVTFKGGSNIVKLTVMPGTTAARDIEVVVVVTPISVDSLALPNNTYELAQAGQVVYGGKSIADITPNKMTYRLADGREIEILTKVDFSKVAVNVGIDGNYDATATIGSGSDARTFNFKVHVSDITLDGVAVGSETITVDINEFRKNGSNVLPTDYLLLINGVETMLPVTLDKSGIEFVKYTMVNGKLVESAGRGGVIKISIGTVAAGNYQETFVNVVITDTISGASQEVVEVDYNNMTGNVFTDLPTTMVGNVKTFAQNNGITSEYTMEVTCAAIFDNNSLKQDSEGNWTINVTLSSAGYIEATIAVKLTINNLPAELAA